jgi:hypothetical protein
VKLTPTSWHIAYCVTRKGEQLSASDERDQPGKMQETADTMMSGRERFAQPVATSADAKDGK